jgi:hypothetical protein
MFKYFNIMITVATDTQRLAYSIQISKCENINNKILTKYFVGDSIFRALKKRGKKGNNHGNSALRFWDWYYRNVLLNQGNLTYELTCMWTRCST